MNVGHTISGMAWTESQASVVKLYVETACGSVVRHILMYKVSFHLRPFLQIGQVGSKIW